MTPKGKNKWVEFRKSGDLVGYKPVYDSRKLKCEQGHGCCCIVYKKNEHTRTFTVCPTCGWFNEW